MKPTILLIDCYPKETPDRIERYIRYVNDAAREAGVELSCTVVHDTDAAKISGEYSAVMVSGSPKMVSDGEYERDLLQFLFENRKPLLGICYGHQVFARAWGATVYKDSSHHSGSEEIVLLKENGIFAGFPQSFTMHQSHWEYVSANDHLLREFNILAEDGNGRVECIKHHDLPLYGVQFHPELSGQAGIRLLWNFFTLAHFQSRPWGVPPAP